jgi:short-subunit dehydrogenase
MPLKKLHEQVVVITGASSGIGLTTAEMAAERGARVVLSSRNEEALRKAVQTIHSRGGQARYVVADVANPDAVQGIAGYAIREFGAFDTWVNNAGTGTYGAITNTPLAEKRRVFDVNFWGVVHGCRAAVPHLRERGGAIVNIGSGASDVALPLLGIYSASKQAVKGYTDALRMELEKEGVPISITLIKPSSINTPFIEHAREHLGTEPEYSPPVYAPEEVARAILHAAEKPIRDITVGASGKLLSIMSSVAPRTTDVFQEAVQFRLMKGNRSRNVSDALYQPGHDRRYGPTARPTMKRSLYTRAVLSDSFRALSLLASGVLLAAVMLRRKL